MAERFLKVPLAATPHRELLYRMQSFAKVEIADGRAIVWKQFWADEPLAQRRALQDLARKASIACLASRRPVEDRGLRGLPSHGVARRMKWVELNSPQLGSVSARDDLRAAARGD